ncbi:hypothetical protein AMAG_19156 [Allomyces macrogynus ATCC 38327]|uniref:Uncharacterized protein n=1 Tax=Allomyces macrogynus (strain ATCC 38327) TaxID=578462 RepID=A0A0L0SPP1_ALLM3|nr:hypothetical protein AMAG_19156 [Allomyces macrogynus ATCC 38327]|eukprot:KNE64379.1 hypothetical protein AMAG_19156 [Allomyces macrogynus ATCC 38327]
MAGPTKVMVRLTVRTRPHPQGKRDGPKRTPVYRFSVHVEALDAKTGKVPDSRVLPRLCARIAVELHETFNPPTRDLERQPDGTYVLHELDAWGSFTGKVLFEFHNEIHASIHMGLNVDLGTPETSTVRALVVRLSDADKKKYLVTSPMPVRKPGAAGGSLPPPPPPPAYVPAPPMRAAALAAARRIPAANAASPTAPSSSALSSAASSSPSSASSVSSAGGSPPLGATRSRGPTPSGARSIKEPAGAGQARANATVRSAPAAARPSATGPRTAAGAGDAAPPRRASTSAASRRPPATSEAPRADEPRAPSRDGTAGAVKRPLPSSSSSASNTDTSPPPAKRARTESLTQQAARRGPAAARGFPDARVSPLGDRPSPSVRPVAQKPSPSLPSPPESAALRARTEVADTAVARRGPAAARGFPDARVSPLGDRPSPSVRPVAQKPSPSLPSPPESAALVPAPPPPAPTALSSSSSPGATVVAQIAAQIRTLRIDDVLDLARLVHAHADDLGRVMTADGATNALQFHVAAFSPTLVEAVVAFLAEPRDMSGAGAGPRQVRPNAAVNGMTAPARMITS